MNHQQNRDELKICCFDCHIKSAYRPDTHTHTASFLSLSTPRSIKAAINLYRVSFPGAFSVSASYAFAVYGRLFRYKKHLFESNKTGKIPDRLKRRRINHAHIQYTRIQYNPRARFLLFDQSSLAIQTGRLFRDENICAEKWLEPLNDFSHSLTYDRTTDDY